MTTTSLAEAKAHLCEVVNRVRRQHERVTVTVHGHPSAVLLSPEDLRRHDRLRHQRRSPSPLPRRPPGTMCALPWSGA